MQQLESAKHLRSLQDEIENSIRVLYEILMQEWKKEINTVVDDYRKTIEHIKQQKDEKINNLKNNL